MTKSEFLDTLRQKLSGLPEKEVESRLTFYSEMIDDRVEDGVLEPAAVWQLGSIDDIASEIIAGIPLKKLVKNKIKHRRLKVWEITLIAAGSPVWFPITLSLVAVAFAIYVAIWAVIISLWASAVAICASAVGCVAGSVIIAGNSSVPAGIVTVGMGLVLAGISIFAFYGCKMATKGFHSSYYG